jgi:hypothetical protein
MVPAFAVAHGRVLSAKTDENVGFAKEIVQNEQKIADDKNKISSDSDPIKYHGDILQDTLEKMNDVKWYQFWKWKFFLYDGPDKIKEETSIITSLSKNLNNSSQNLEEKANSSIQTSLNLDKENITANTTDILYNTGEASVNANIIREKLSAKFQTEYTVSKPENLKTGDIVQYPLSHNNYVYLQFVGMNPTGDKALFLGSQNTAIRIPESDLKTLKFKITPKNSLLTTNSLSSTNKKNTIDSPLQNLNTLEQTSYIANIQKEGLKNYTNTKISEINDLIGIKNESKNTGTKLMISGGALEVTSLILSGVVTTLLSVECGLEITISVMSAISIMCMPVIVVSLAISGAITGTISALTVIDVIIGVLSLASVSLELLSVGLLAAGGGLYATANYALKDLDSKKTNVETESNLINTDLKTYNEGNVNHLPVVANIKLDTEQNSVLKSTLNSTDDDGDGVIYFLVNKPFHGNVTLLKNGSYEYKPTKGYSGNDSFTYVASDIFGNSNTATIEVAVHPVNHPPVTANMNFDIEQSNNLTQQLQATDSDNDPLSYHIINSPSNGNITLNKDGSFSYIPNIGFIGNDTFTYTAKDWKGDGNTATVKINVHQQNHLPVTENSTIKVAKNEKITGRLTATDEDMDNLFYRIVSKPLKGNITLNLDGTFTYVPLKNMKGNDAFTFIVNDWQGKSNPSKVSIEIYEFNHPPIAENITTHTTKNKPYQGSFKAKDIDYDKLTFQVVVNPTKGTLTNLGSGKFIYKPNKDFTGIDKFIYTASDGNLTSNATVIIITNKPTKKHAMTLKNNFISNENSDEELDTKLDIPTTDFSNNPRVAQIPAITPANQNKIAPSDNPKIPSLTDNNPLAHLKLFFFKVTTYLGTIVTQITNNISSIQKRITDETHYTQQT